MFVDEYFGFVHIVSWMSMQIESIKKYYRKCLFV